MLNLKRNEQYTIDDTTIFWKGIFCYKEEKVGLNSIKLFTEDFLNDRADYNDLFGCYYCVIKQQDIITAFVDNMGFFPLYYTLDGKIIGDSLINIVNDTKERIELNKTSIFNFLELGFILNKETFIKNIKRLDFDSIYTFKDNAEANKQNKNLIKQIKSDYSWKDFESRLKHHLKAFSNEKPIFDITGGTDSRLVSTIASNVGLDFELFVRGKQNCADIDVASQISEILDKKLNYRHSEAITNFSEESMKLLFTELDGNYSFFDGKQLLDSYKNKKDLSFKFNLGGIAGEYYKQYWILRNGKKSNNCGGYTETVVNNCRIKISKNLFSNEVKDAYSIYSNQFFASCGIEDITKLKTYNRWYSNQFFPNNSGILYGVAANYCNNYGILADYEFVLWTYNLTRKDKKLNKIYRQIISRNNRQLAKLKTIYGMTLSTSVFDILHDIFVTLKIFYLRFTSRILKKKMYKPDSFGVSQNTDNNVFRNSECVKNAVLFLKQSQFLAEDFDNTKATSVFLERMVTVYFWMKLTNKN